MSQRSGQPMLVVTLVATGVLSILAGAALAIAVDPLLGLIALAGVLDLFLAGGFATGRLGRGSPEVADDLAPGEASLDPEDNPYARED